MINYDPDDATHVHFIVATANLFSYLFNVAPLQDKRASCSYSFTKTHLSYLVPVDLAIESVNLGWQQQNGQDNPIKESPTSHVHPRT